MPTVEKLGDIRRVQGEVKVILFAARMEYLIMACMVIGNLPLLYLLNKDWYAALKFSEAGRQNLREQAGKIPSAYICDYLFYLGFILCSVYFSIR